jgi:superfamily II DNA helicase RecQ
MHDKTLKELATMKPEHKSELLSVNGIGQAKFLQYGDEIIALIDQFEKAEIN